MPSESEVSTHRLPRTVVPSAYEIELEPDLGSATFVGRVSIEAEVSEATSSVVMNAIELKVTQASVTDATGATHTPTINHDEQTERLTLTLDDALTPGPITIALAFEGMLNDKLRGFYRSTFEDSDGALHTIATTQFESTDARRAFPCWDEPDLKATFTVSLVVDEHLLAISSGPETTREPIGNGRVRVSFAETMLMSTYLLAFVVGPLEATQAVDVDGIPLRVVHPPGKGHLSTFALDVGAFSLRHFTDYFGLPYPGAKLDLVALPDFAFGAMENLGCVTFREALLLLDPEETTQPEQQRAADVIAHEIAHMWFGDLVTMKWWNGIWLKEAFATFCEMHATNAMRPEWLRWDDFGLSRSAAFNVDSLLSTRPIEFDVVSPDDAEAMYDILTYEKGAAVVRMLEQFLGEEAFRDGIRSYLQRHAYGNTENHHLWDAIEDVTGQPARRIMDSWIFQGGYPIVSIDRTSPTSVRLTQQRFVYDGHSEPTCWSVPVVLAVGDSNGRRRVPVLLDDTETEVDLGPEPVEWVVGNADASGFYRVRSDDGLQQQALAHLDELTGVERYSLVDDAWAATLAGTMHARDLIQLVTDVAADEEDTAVWRRIVGIMRSIDDHLDDARDRHRVVTLDLIAGAMSRVGREPSPDESEQVTELRAALFEAAGVLGDQGALATARELLDAPADPPRNAAAVRVVAACGGSSEFEQFVSRYLGADSPQEERRYLFALPAFPGADEAQRLFEMLDADEIRSQDGAYVLGRGLSNDATAAEVWAYIETGWDTIGDRYPDNSIPRMLEGAQSVGDPDVAGAIAAFFETHEVPQAGLSLDQHLERMWVTVALRQRLREQLGRSG